MYERASDGRMVLSRTWMIFFERLRSVESSTTIGRGKGPFQRTLLLKNTEVGNDIADHTTVYEAGRGVGITGVLRKPITTNLTVRLKKHGITIIQLTIPFATPVDTIVESTSWLIPTPVEFEEGQVLTWDVTASDGSKDVNGVASFTIEWTPPEEPPAARRRR